MTEPTTQQLEGAEVPANEPESRADEPKSFDADYVTKLREEAAQHRVDAKEANERAESATAQLLELSKTQAVAGILRDASDLPPGDYLTDGVPDVDKIRAAAEALVEAKPYLAAVSGDVSQGPRGDAPAPSLGALIRERIGG